MIQRISAAVAASLLLATAAAAQTTRPHLAWRTLRTEHFDVHYPVEAEAWTLDLAARLEAVHDTVAALVGGAPETRTTIVVDDPAGLTNGFAFSTLDRPAITVWPTPPGPRSNLAENRGHAEQLAVHEFAHVAHLTRPSRNPRERLLARVSPFPEGPVSRRAPRWVKEGYATWVEGRVTGRGRPHSAIRAAILRQWALEGRLPTYAQLDGSAAYQGANMAYMAGSAFLEWLVERRGEESLVHLWRRLSARQPRSFEEAFAGVYGGTPADLYGRFTVDVTERALRVRDALEAAGRVEGDTVQRLSWQTGDPAVSPDGEHLAIALDAPRGRPGRVVVWEARAPEDDSAAAVARARLLERDPEDVPAIRWRPRPRRALATLGAAGGREHRAPRFLPGGDSLLVVRSEPLPDGTLRPDLFVWRWREGSLRRATRGAGVHDADPAPDGRTAYGVRCLAGICDLVRIDLRTGGVDVLAPGGVRRVWDRPRVSPDGRTVAAALQSGGRWRVALVDAASGAVRLLDPDDGAARYDPAWLPDGRLVVVSEAGGIANLEAIDVAARRARPLTRVTGAAAAPAPGPSGGVLFLALHGGGWDLRRVHPDSVHPGPVVAVDPELAPAARRPPAADTLPLPASPLPAPRPYGAGPRAWRVLPTGVAEADGGALGLLVLNGDPVGRLAVSAEGLWGDPEVERGGAFAAAWRGSRPAVEGRVFWSERAGGPDRLSPAGAGELSGAVAALDLPLHGSAVRHRLRVGGALGAWAPSEGEARARRLGFAEYAATASRGAGTPRSVATGLRLHASAGETAGEPWARGVASLATAFQVVGMRLEGSLLAGLADGGAPAAERFAVGGRAAQLAGDDVLSQQVAMPGLPLGVLAGRRVAAARVATRLGMVEPFAWAASTDRGFDRWLRVVGAEVSAATPAVPALRLPALRATAGLAHSLDEPYADRTHLYLDLRYAP